MNYLITLFTFYFYFSSFFMNQPNQKDLMLSYSKFISLNDFEQADQIEKLYVFNDSTLIFPVLEKDLMPKNGIIMEVPDWIRKFKNIKELFMVGLYISNLNSHLAKLPKLEKLKFAIPKNSDIEKLIAELSNLKTLKILDLSDSTISENQLKLIQKRLPKIKIINSNFQADSSI